MVSVCCLLPYGPEADILRLQIAEHTSRHPLNHLFEIMPPGQIPGGFSLYVCAAEQIIETMYTVDIGANKILAYGDGSQLYFSLQLGVADFLKKPWDFSELLARAEKAWPCIDFDLSWGRVISTGYKTSINGLELDLPEALQRLLRIFVENAGQVISRKNLLRLYGLNTCSRTIDIYVMRLRQAIKECTGQGKGIIEARYGQGYTIAR